MQHRAESATEIAPDHWISVPVFAKSNDRPSSTVTEANHQAEQGINAHKDTFIKLCLETLFPDEEVGEAMLKHASNPNSYIPALIAKLDPAKLSLTIRNEYSPTIVIPSHHSPEQAKQTGHTRQTGHSLTMKYDDHWLGSMEVTYRHDGTIGVNISTKE
jgi:hypothetical protein